MIPFEIVIPIVIAAFLVGLLGGLKLAQHLEG